MGDKRIMVGGELERIIRSHYDVLMDGYPWYAGIRYHHDALSLAVELLKANPRANIQVRLTKIMERLDSVYLGTPEEPLAKVMS